MTKPRLLVFITIFFFMLPVALTAQTENSSLNKHLRELVEDCKQRYQALATQGNDTTGIGTFQALLEEYCQALRSPDTQIVAEDGINPWGPIITLATIYQSLQLSRIDALSRFVRSYYASKDKEAYFPYCAFLEQYYIYNMRRHYLTFALNTAEEMIQVAEEAGDTTLITAVGYYFAANAYVQLGDAVEMERCLNRVYEIGRDRAGREQNLEVYYNYASGLAMLAKYYASQGRCQQALNLAEDMCEGIRDRFTEVSTQYILALMAKVDILNNCGQYTKTLALLDSIESLGQQLPPNFQQFWENVRSQLNVARQDLNVSNVVTGNLLEMGYAELNREILTAFGRGDYKHVIAAGRLWMEHCEEEEKPNFVNYSNMLRVLISAYGNTSQYTEALALLQHAEGFFLERNTSDPLAVRVVYALYGDLYKTISDFQRAIDFYNRSKLMYEEAGDLSGPYRLVVLNLCYAYVSFHDYAYARLFGEEIIEMVEKMQAFATSDQQEELNVYRHSVYTAFQSMGYDVATAKRFSGIDNPAEFNESSSLYAVELINQVLSKFVQRNLPETRSLLDRLYQSGILSLVSEDERNRIDIIRIICNVADGDTVAVRSMKQLNNSARQNIMNVFDTFSESEREAFWEGQVVMLNYGNGTLAYHFQNYPETAVLAYDNALFVKNLLNTSASLIRRLVMQSGDKKLQGYYQKMVNMKERISKRNTPVDSVDDYRHQVIQAERDILRLLGNQKDVLDRQFLCCSDVRQMLGENDVAVEFIEFSTFDENLEDVSVYAALVLRRDDTAPHFVTLCKQEDIYDIWQNVIHTDTALVNRQYAIDNVNLYNMVWKPITSLLKEGDHVYFSLTGQLNRINFHALSNGRQRLADVYDLHLVTSTANISQIRKHTGEAYNSATVYGGVEFRVSADDMIEAASSYGRVAGRDGDSHSQLMATRSSNNNRGAINELPGTLEEAESIVDVLRSNHVNANLLQGNYANEESFKAMDGRSPQIIHVATHGFMLNTYDDMRQHRGFLESLRNNSVKGSAMELSGLLMAGAFQVWLNGGNVPEGVEDGILTAAEISRLDLSNTRLMVLSACETGLTLNSTVDDFGLKRGLKNAGVETLVMSLWEVPDDATTLLITSFFNNLTKGMPRHRALLEAQKKVQQEFPQPYCWAGFVILD